MRKGLGGTLGCLSANGGQVAMALYLLLALLGGWIGACIWELVVQLVMYRRKNRGSE